jgi:hypothetical protein
VVFARRWAVEERRHRQFALQRGACFGTFSDVRMFLAFTTLISVAATASAQEQERKLVDRLLRPNMALANSAQNKQFVATSTTLDKRAPTKSFYVPEKSLAKSFIGERTFSAQQFAVRHFRTGDSAASIAPRSQPTKSDTVYATPAAPATRAAAEAERSVATTSVTGSRPFLDRGKSQKALSAHDTPLTIEQVRELLNKNK